MSKAAKQAATSGSRKTTNKSESKNPFDGRAVAIQLMDTAWRVAVPIILLSYIGIKLDQDHNSQPLYTLVGFFLSLAVSSTLVYRQIKDLYPDFFKWGKR